MTGGSKSAFESVASLSDDALVLVDGTGKIATCNEAFARLVGGTITELTGRPFESLCLEPDALAQALRAWRRTTAPTPARLTLRLADKQHACRIRGRLHAADDRDAHVTLRIDAPGADSFVLLGQKIEELTAEMQRRERAESAAHAAVERMQRLQHFTASLADPLSVSAGSETIVREGMRLLRATIGACVWSPLDGAPLLIARQGDWSDEALAALEPQARDPLIDALATGEPVWTTTPEELAASYPRFAACLKGGVPGAAAALPIRTHERTFGAVFFGFESPGHPPPEVRELLRTLVGLAAQVLQRAELFTAEQRARLRVEGLRNLGDALAAALTVTEVARVVVSRAKQAADADICTLYLMDAAKQNLLLIDEAGCAPEVLERIHSLPVDSDNVASVCVRSGSASWVESQADYVRIMPDLAKVPSQSPRARAFWCAPLSVEGETLGALGMGYYGERQFTPDERAFVLAFSQQCADALRRADRMDRERVARAAAERAQQWLQTTLSSIADGVIATDAAGAIRFMNPVAETLTGVPQNEALGKPLRDVFRIVNEVTRQALEDPVATVLREGRVVDLANHTVLLGRSREVPIDDSGAPIRNDSGAIAGVVLVFRDVTEKKRAETRRNFLAEASSIFAHSLDYRAILSRVAELAVPQLADWCAVDMLDDDGRLRRIAVAHRDPTKTALARELAERYPPDPEASYGAWQVIRTGVSAFYPEISDDLLAAVSRADEHLALMRDLRLRSALVVPLRGRHQARGALTLVHAESNRTFTRADLDFAEEFGARAGIASENAWLFAAEQAARAQADQASRAKDQFLATVSHELRTPLNAILGWSKLLSAATEEQQRRRAVEVIERNAVSMAQLIEDLLDVSRILSGKMRIDVQPVDLAGVARAALESMRPAADAKGIRISFVAGSVAPVNGDPARLQQVVWNLLSNAVKFSGRGARVEVVLRQVDSSAEIVVSDTGQGIDPAFLPAAFDSFRQQDASSTRKHGGLGLGLAIVKHLVELHGGTIAAQSAGPGRGASFSVRLPVSVLRRSDTAPLTPLAPPTPIKPTRTIEGVRVLVVDDDADARTLLQAFLQESGGVVTTAASVDEGMAALTREAFDVLLSDIGMPGEDGFDFIRRVRTLPDAKLRRLPAAALTAYARAEDRRKVLQAGYLMHVPKPLEPAEVIAVVETLARVGAHG